MEEMLEAIIIIIVAVIGIASKANKKKKKNDKPQKPVTNAWDELSESVEKRFDEFIEKHDGEPVIPYAPQQPVQVQPAPAQPVPVQPVIIPQPEPEIHVEGMPAEPVLKPIPKPRLKTAEKNNEPIKTMHRSSRSPLLPKSINADTLRSAVVMSEVLGKPVSLRNTARR